MEHLYAKAKVKTLLMIPIHFLEVWVALTSLRIGDCIDGRPLSPASGPQVVEWQGAGLSHRPWRG